MRLWSATPSMGVPGNRHAKPGRSPSRGDGSILCGLAPLLANLLPGRVWRDISGSSAQTRMPEVLLHRIACIRMKMGTTFRALRCPINRVALRHPFAVGPTHADRYPSRGPRRDSAGTYLEEPDGP